MSSVAVVMSGLPASGKSTLGRYVAAELQYAFLDKDDFLEQLFTGNAETSAQMRSVLSRQSDLSFQAAAEAESHVVLVSHWRPHWRTPAAELSSGTPSQWLKKQFDTVIEVYCVCSIPVAAKRFVERTRHRAHGDDRRDLEGVVSWMSGCDDWFPLGVGQCLPVRTDQAVSIDNVIEIRQFCESILSNVQSLQLKHPFAGDANIDSAIG